MPAENLRITLSMDKIIYDGELSTLSFWEKESEAAHWYYTILHHLPALTGGNPLLINHLEKETSIFHNVSPPSSQSTKGFVDGSTVKVNGFQTANRMDFQSQIIFNVWIFEYMSVSINMGSPKWMVYNRKSHSDG